MATFNNLFVTPLVDIDLTQMGDAPIALVPVCINNKKHVNDVTTLMTHCAFGTSKVLKALDIQNYRLSFSNNGFIEHWLLFAVCTDAKNRQFCLLKLLDIERPSHSKATG
ncbi:hypothetical protein VIN01S_00700 [Vibrio inusitatus NBRC 102082]|uniref:Uncharacterized protein n=1 Tax=Vibrio inusitatus NBRC 102082 TaxID=1219070 RepID=A0A4Y3HQB0_9VIBR|nr:hypothetical protein [Vibrio inusitatus]GEA49266.1 hypothetical protein VIN01S_00700 [Vibrio inusitatus NBRC 102082]